MPHLSKWFFMVVVAAAPFAMPQAADALVISGGPGNALIDNNTAPDDDPGFNRVGQMGTNGSGVYLGNGWVLTANHVNGKDTFVLNGNTYTYAGGPGRLKNPAGSGLSEYSDLYLARYTLTAGTAPTPQGMLTVRGTTPDAGDAGMMIGTGKTDGWPTPSTYYVDTDYIDSEENNVWQWKTSDFDEADQTFEVYSVNAARERRWAISDVATYQGHVQIVAAIGNNGAHQIGFVTEFADQLNSGQAAENDSGSGLFIKNGDTWELAGIAHAILGFNGQPANTAIYGNLTFYSDLSVYADQINTIIPEPSAAVVLAGLSLALLRRKR